MRTHAHRRVAALALALVALGCGRRGAPAPVTPVAPVVAPDLAGAVRVQRAYYSVDRPGNWTEELPDGAHADADVLILSPGGCDVILVAGDPGGPPEQAIAAWLVPPIPVTDSVTEPIDRWGSLEGRGVVIRGTRLGEPSVQTRFATSDGMIGIATICSAAALPLEQPGIDLIRDSFVRR